MKPSHFQTPRTLGESTFWHGGEAFERPVRSRFGVGWWIAASALALVALTLIAGAR